MRFQNTLRGFVHLVLLVGCLNGAVFAQSANRVEAVAAIAADRTQVRWTPQVEYGRLILTVSTPAGTVFRQEFDAGATPTFGLTDKDGANLPDGNYSYELRVIPNLSGEVRKALAASREKGDSAQLVQELQRSGQLPASVTVQNGSFLVEKGQVLTGSPEDGVEPQRSGQKSDGAAIELQSRKRGGARVGIQDVVTADDIIVQGSGCFGLDCVNNENFGFDTIRLKENNTRLQFDDTSGAGFATNNWQIRANSSAAGGASFLGFVDQGATGNSETGTIVFSTAAGAPANSLFVSSTGRVGLRTGTPVLDLHIATGDTPAHRLEQTAAGGFTAQTWDIAGNEANFFVRDVTGGSRLPFRIRPGAPTSSLDINASGFVGIGTASPGFPLHVIGNSRFAAANVQIELFGAKGGAGNAWVLQTVDADGRFRVFDNILGGGERITVLQNGNVGIGTAVPAGKLDVNGTIFQRGLLLHADYVFEPEYTLESIEEHSEFMWDNKHLPAMGARTVDEKGQEVVEIGSRLRGMLEELEKAHIYISTLNQKVTEKDEQMAKLAHQNAELAQRLARIEALLTAAKDQQK
jgi:hypothetical protein